MGFFSFYQLFPILFLGIFALIMGLVFTSFVRAGRENRKNDNSPRITSDATVVTKRTHVWGDHSHTDYYATFQFPSGDRLELQVPHSEFGYLVEGDRGKLTFQGTRFLGFERN